MNRNEPLEQAMLSALLIKPALLPDVTAVLQPEMFSSPIGGWIYGAILQVYDRGEVPDYLMVENELRRLDCHRMEETGGIGWLGNALVQVQYGDNALQYALEIRRLYILRQLTACFKKLTGKASMDDGDPLAIMGEADDCLLQIRQKGRCGANVQPFSELAADAIAKHRSNRTKGRGHMCNVGPARV
ncbi:MAG: hypothetical protein LUH15_11010 [Tannerellaceae bacterium]|nr:hypothetical protein [Tannerellaceae bacterium]